MASEFPTPIVRALETLLHELIDGPPAGVAFVLNQGDPGLLASLKRLSADEASQRPAGRSSVASHVDHLGFGLELMNRWSRGESPFGDADYAASWTRQLVTTEQWQSLQASLASEARAWMAVVSERRDWDDNALTVALSVAVHLAYHMGAIRQLVAAAAGPPA